MAVMSCSVFRDSCEVMGNRYFKIPTFPCVWIFLRCLHEEENKSSSCLEWHRVSRPAGQHSCNKLTFHMDLSPYYWEVWSQRYSSELIKANWFSHFLPSVYLTVILHLFFCLNFSWATIPNDWSLSVECSQKGALS